MTRRHRVGLAITAAIVASHLLGGDAYGDPLPDFAHIQTASHLTTDGGSKLDLPPGYFLSEPTYSKLDTEMKRLQDQETRQTAEIKVYKTEIEKWQPGWMTLTGAIVGGVVLGWYAHDKL